MKNRTTVGINTAVIALVAGTLLLAAGTGWAATLFWDANGEDPGTGGTGNWDSTSLSWRDGSSTGTLTNWVDGSIARFEGTAGTVTLKENVSVDGSHINTGGLRFNTSGYTLAADPGYTLTIEDGSDRPFSASGTITIDAPIHIARNGLVYLAGSTVTINGSISVAGTSTKVAGWGGMLVLGGSNGFTGTDANDGYNYSLRIDNDNALNGKRLRWASIASLSAGINNPVLTSNAGFGNDQMAVFQSTNSLSLLGDSVYQIGGTTLTRGINVEDAAATLTFGSLQEMPGGGVVGWNGWLTKIGAGTLRIDGRYSCGGRTTVSNGTMIANGLTGDRTGESSYVAMPDWVVCTGATLGGTGTVWVLPGSIAVIESGGALAPGAAASNSVSTFTVDGSMTLAEGAIYQWEYEEGVGDLVDVTGTLTLPAAATVQASHVSGDLPSPTILFSATALAGATDLSGWTILGLDKHQAIIDGTDVILFVPPPPGSLFLMR